MIDFFIHYILLQQFLLGFIFYMTFREWLFPKMRRKLLKDGERTQIIWRHHQLRASFQGHSAASVEECYEGNCDKL